MKNNRELNFEILRILCMFYIVIWHAIIHGIIRNKYGGIDNTNIIECINFFIMQYVAILTSV